VAWSKVLTFTDPFPYATAVRAADMQVFPTAKGELRAEVTQVVMNQLWMQRFNENLPLVHKWAIKPRRRVFGFLTEANQPELYACGRLLLPCEIHENKFEEQHQKTGGHCSFGTMSLATEDFTTACKAIVGREFAESSTRRFIRPNAGLVERLLKLHETVGRIARTTPDLFAVAEVVRALEQQLIHLLVRCVTGGIPSDLTGGGQRHRMIVSRFEAFLEANPNTPLYLQEICAAVGAAERTLRVACEEHLGMGPIRYLALRRMHLVRRALLKADSSTTVTQIATDHGFWELGRFSVAYRTLFGETPSVTLKRPPDDYRDFPNRPSSFRGQ
jgi:AraC-like DNA-binding protein